MVTPERHSKAMDKVQALVSVRERTRGELAGRLARAGFSEEEVADAVACAVRVGLVSDERFARAYIGGKSHAGWGRQKILRKLAEFGIADELLDACEDEFPAPEQEYEQALRELAKRSSHSSNPYASYMRRLVGKGYSYDIAKRAVTDYMN